MTNDMAGGIALGFGIAITFVAIFQIGINMGIKSCLSSIEHEYPAAFKFLQRNKNAAKVLPYVIGGNNE